MAEWGSYQDVNTLLNGHGRRLASKTFIESIHQAKGISFAQANGVCNRVARFLQSRGVRADDRIAILGENCIEALLCLYGALKYGAAVTPLNIEESGQAIHHILHAVRPRLVFWQGTLRERRPDLVNDGPGEWIPFGQWDAPGPPEGELFGLLGSFPDEPFPASIGCPDAIGLLLFTSGTTAQPKGILWSHQAYAIMVQEVMDRFEIGEADRVLEYRAYHWGSPQLFSLGSALHTGATLVLARKFSQSHFFDWLRDYRISVVAGVPTVLQMLLARPVPVHKRDLPALRFMTSSSAPLPREIHEAFEARYGIPIVQGCGMSEAGFMAGNSPRWRKLGTIGRPMRYTTLRFVDEVGRECVPGEEGEMVVSGPKLATGYLAGTGEMLPISPDGFSTGDLGYRDADGFIVLTGRKKDLIIRGGVNISPGEVTETLLTHPGVAEVATFGVPDPIYGEEVASVVVRRPGAPFSAEELVAHCRTRLPEYKVPKALLFVDAIPKTDRGKVAKRDLLRLWNKSAGAALQPGLPMWDGRGGRAAASGA